MHLIFVLNTNFQGKPKKGYNIQGIRGETNMKKIYSLFILSILALTMFVGCQMNPEDDSKPVDNTPIVDAEYTITIDAPHGTVTLDKTKAKVGETVQLTKLEADDGYILKTMSIKKENGEDVTEFDRKNQSFIMPNCNVTITVEFKAISSGGDTSTYTVSVPSENYITSSSSSYRLAIQNAPIDGYKKGDQVEILITNGNSDVNTGYGTPTGLYLVKVHIKEGETELTDIPVTITKDHKIQFTMPEKNINVFAQFCDIKISDTFMVANATDNKVTEVLCFNSKAYDNLEPVDGKYVFKVRDLIGTKVAYEIKYGDYELNKYELSEDGTLNDNQYTFGVIDANGKLTILQNDNDIFGYNPDAPQIK